MTDTTAVLLNVNDDQSVVHRSPAFEECNLDDATNRKHVDPRTAAALIASGQARTCEHCMPTIEGEPL